MRSPENTLPAHATHMHSAKIRAAPIRCPAGTGPLSLNASYVAFQYGRNPTGFALRCGAGNPARGRPSGRLDPLKGWSEGCKACPTVHRILVILHAALH